MSETLSTLLISLGSAAFGSVSTIVAQYLPTRAQRRHERAAQAKAEREELKEVLLDFLRACQKVERLAERRAQEGKYVEGSPELTHEMKLHQKMLAIIAGPHLGELSKAYSDALLEATYGRLPQNTDVWAYMRRKREPLLAGATAALGKPVAAL